MCSTECSALNELLIKESSLHASDCLNGERKLAELDKQGTELKIQVVELELEITMKQQEHDKECQEIQNKLLKQEQLASDYHASWLNEVNQLKVVIEEASYHLLAMVSYLAKKMCVVERGTCLVLP